MPLAQEERRRIFELGLDPLHGFSHAEARTALRLERQRGVRLRRHRGTAVEWEADGRAYDAFGASGPGGEFQLPSTRSLIKHLAKAYVVVDWNEVPGRDRAALQTFVSTQVQALVSRTPALGRHGIIEIKPPCALEPEVLAFIASIRPHARSPDGI